MGSIVVLLKSIISVILYIYLYVGVWYGLWVLAYLQFRECGLFYLSCPNVGKTPSLIIEILRILPDVVPFSVAIAFGRAIAWPLNLYSALSTSGWAGIKDWFFVIDVPPMPYFYANVGHLFP